MKNCRTLILSSFLLSGFIVGAASAQPMQSLDQRLSLLRGMWETHTFREKFRITFLDDKRMVYDRLDAAYAVSPERINIHTEKSDLTYSYAFRNDKLVLIDAYGKELDLNRERFGLAERQCLGDYFSGYDTSGCEELLAFNEDGTFSYSRQCNVTGTDSNYDNEVVKITNLGKYDGLYRIENTFIVLAFDNGLVREAMIRFRDSNDKVTGIVFNGKIFDKEFQADEPIVYQPPPPCLGCDPPPPPPPPPPPRPDPGCPSSGGISSPPPEPVRTHRDTGPTRGDSGSGTADTGSRQGGRRPL